MNKANVRTGRPHRATLLTVAIFLFLQEVLLRKLDLTAFLPKLVENSIYLSSNSSSSLDNALYSNKQPHFFPCIATASMFDKQELEVAIVNATDFHMRGGNLKSVQNLMDSSIDETLGRNRYSFVLRNNGNSQSSKSILSKNINADLRNFLDRNAGPRGGYGASLPGEFVSETNFKDVLHEGRRVDVGEPRHDFARFDASTGPFAPQCTHVTKLLAGTTREDEAKFFCGNFNQPAAHNNSQTAAPEYNQHHQNHNQEKCIVISIGSNDQWGMETALMEYGCETHTFDCTITPKHKPKGFPNMHFYSYCIDSHSWNDTATNQKYLSYADAVRVAKLDRPPTLLKMDIEGFEFDVLSEMLREQYMIPQQIQVELHWATKMVKLPWILRTRSSAELALFSNMMFVTGGYLPVVQTRTRGCYPCQEILYVKVACPR